MQSKDVWGISWFYACNSPGSQARLAGAGPRWLLNYELARTDQREPYLQNKSGARPRQTGRETLN